MTQLGTTPPSGPRGKASNNIYTVLALIAMVALVFGISVIWCRSYQLFGTAHPFKKVNSPRVGLATPMVELIMV